MAKTPTETQAVAAVIFSIGQIDANGSIESKEFRDDYLSTPEFREPITHAIFERHAPARQRFRLIDQVIAWNDEPSRGDFVAVAEYPIMGSVRRRRCRTENAAVHLGSIGSPSSSRSERR
jgi:hypothetical protein